jgi:hypothetical protein
VSSSHSLILPRLDYWTAVVKTTQHNTHTQSERSRGILQARERLHSKQSTIFTCCVSPRIRHLQLRALTAAWTLKSLMHFAPLPRPAVRKRYIHVGSLFAPPLSLSLYFAISATNLRYPPHRARWQLWRRRKRPRRPIRMLSFQHVRARPSGLHRKFCYFSILHSSALMHSTVSSTAP